MGRWGLWKKPLHPYVSVTQEKWDKTKQEIQRLKLEVTQSQENGSSLVLHKVLEQVAGFLNHVARVFLTKKLYLNKVYATLNAWQTDRDEEG
ncbi:hypothetical protein ACA910_022680 [Epithemia clementina (nom. ined.)]